MLVGTVANGNRHTAAKELSAASSQTTACVLSSARQREISVRGIASSSVFGPGWPGETSAMDGMNVLTRIATAWNGMPSKVGLGRKA